MTNLVLVVEASNSDNFGSAAELERHGFTTWHAGSGSDAREVLLAAKRAAMEPDVIVVNRHLPDVDGLVLSAFFRKVISGPIILCSRVSDSVARTLAYRVGIDSIVETPTFPGELQALIQNLLRRIKPDLAGDHRSGDSPGLLKFGSLQIDGRQMAASIDQHHLRLTPTEYRLLVALAKGAPHAVSRSLLSDAAWNAEYDSSRSRIANPISRLRAKFSKLPAGSPAILCVRSHGYQLTKAD